MPEMQHVVDRPIETLRPSARNARTHSEQQIRQIAESIRAFGFLNPILIDGKNQIIAGHGRVESAKLLGRQSVPTLLIDHMTDAQKRAYALADNRLAEKAGWDRDLLCLELGELLEFDLDFDLTVTGFEAPEIDIIVGSAPNNDTADAPFVEEMATNPVSRPGDLWHLSRHRLLCGDATDPKSYDRLLDGSPAEMVVTDPPYNVPTAGHVSGLGRIRHDNFAMAFGEMSTPEYTRFLTRVTRLLAQHSTDGSLHYLFTDWRHMREFLTAGDAAYDELKNLCVWSKTNGGMGSFYRSQHELILVFKKGKASHINNIELGKHGRNRTNVWTYPGVNTFREGRLEELALHPTVKPVALVADAILDASRRNGIVLDPFIGSGTTILAADRTGRVAHGIEIDPCYVDTAIRRWEKSTDAKAVHAETGLGLEALAEARGIDLSQSKNSSSRESDNE